MNLLNKFIKSKNKFIQSYTLPYINTTSSKNNSYASIIKYINDNYFYNTTDEARTIKTIIDYRSSWILNRNTEISSKNEETNNFIKDFINRNKFQKLLIYISQLLEIQGNVLLKIIKRKEENRYNFYIRIYNYSNYPYSFEKDSEGIIKEAIIYTMDFTTRKIYERLNEEDFFYIILYGNEDIMNTSYVSSLPPVAYALKDIENIVKVKEDIRNIHNIFAHPIPFFKSDDYMSKEAMMNAIKNANWKIGHSLFFSQGEDFDFKQASLQGIESLEKEKVSLYQEISGSTGIPIFLLGFPELIGGGRATAQEFAEAINVSTSQQRTTTQEYLKYLIMHIIKLNNKYNNEILSTDDIIVRVPETSLHLIRTQIEMLNTMYDRRTISLKTYLKNNPLIENSQDEMRQLEEDKARELTFTNTILKE